MKYREFKTSSGAKIILGKDAKSNDELMRKFEGKENIIIHTVAPGSPFCVIDDLKPSRKDIAEAAGACVFHSQDWRDNRGNVKVNIFTGKDVEKKKDMKEGTWKVKKSKTKIIKKRKIINLIKNVKNLYC